MKRFYQTVTTSEQDGGWRVLLDGRGIRTAAGRAQVVPTEALALALAAEWERQGPQIDPAAFPMRDLADFTLDVTGPDRAQVIAELLPYAETDTLCYRADPDEALYRRQLELWEPLLAEAERRLGVSFTRVSGVVHRPQPQATLERLREELAAMDPFALTAARMLASLAASLVIALEAVRPQARAEALWAAANLEEDWQVALWGEDAEAAERRALRFESFGTAMALARLARG